MSVDTDKQIFVFGSNLAGRHGAGAALHAAKYYDAEYGVGEGMTGNAYAIPTKDENLEVRPLADISASINRFCDVARANRDRSFLLSPIGTGFAGLPVEWVWNQFHEYTVPSNVYLTSSWITDNHPIVVPE